jgi:hypothetical protein
MRNLRLVVGTLLLLAALSGCGAAGWWLVVGSGVAAEQVVDASGFTSVSAGSGFSVEIAKGDAFAVVVRTDDNVLPHVRASLDGDRLVLGLEPGLSYWTTVLHASITMPELRGMSFAGGVTASVGDGFSTESTLSVALSGGSRLTMASVACGGLDVDLSGGSFLSGAASCPLGAATLVLAGGSRLTMASVACGGLDVDLSGGSVLDGAASCPQGAATLVLAGGSEVRSLVGSAATLNLMHSGGGRAELSELAVDTGSVELSGGAAATVSVQTSLTVTLAGGSSLRYRSYAPGPALTIVSVSGGSSISAF